MKFVEDDSLTIEFTKLKNGDEVRFTEYNVGSFNGVVKSIDNKKIFFDKVEFIRSSEAYQDSIDYSSLYNISTYTVDMEQLAEIKNISDPDALSFKGGAFSIIYFKTV